MLCSMSLIRKQCAALPYRVSGEGKIEVMLVTSRGSGRWIVPKGWPIPGRTLAFSAGREAFEEAGIVGPVIDSPIGKYRYIKSILAGIPLPCEVTVFPLPVHRELRRWPEQHERTRRWFGQFEAANLVQEQDLRALLSDPHLSDRITEAQRNDALAVARKG